MSVMCIVLFEKSVQAVNCITEKYIILLCLADLKWVCMEILT